MHIKKITNRHYEIVDVPGCPEGCGPYETRAEAQRDMRGMARTFRAIGLEPPRRERRGKRRDGAVRAVRD